MREISKDEYLRELRLQRAGSDVDWVSPEAKAHWQAQGWKGKHWLMVHGPAIIAVNVKED